MRGQFVCSTSRYAQSQWHNHDPGKGATYLTSCKQNLNTKNLTEAELLAIYDAMVQVLWTRYFWQLWVCSSLQQQSTKITKVQYYFCKWRQLSTAKCTSKYTFGAYHLSLWQNKKIKMTANDRDSCNITVVFAWMGVTWILVVRIDCKIAVGCHTMLIESCANHSTKWNECYIWLSDTSILHPIEEQLLHYTFELQEWGLDVYTRLVIIKVASLRREFREGGKHTVC